MAKQTVVHLIESEAGWCTAVDEVKYFDKLRDAQEFVEDFNKDYDFSKRTPSYYYIAQIVEEGDA